MGDGFDYLGRYPDRQPGWTMVDRSNIEMTVLEIVGAVTIAWWTIKLIVPGL